MPVQFCIRLNSAARLLHSPRRATSTTAGWVPANKRHTVIRCRSPSGSVSVNRISALIRMRALSVQCGSRSLPMISASAISAASSLTLGCLASSSSSGLKRPDGVMPLSPKGSSTTTFWPFSRRARAVMRASSPLGSIASTEPSYISKFGTMSETPLPPRDPATVSTWRLSSVPMPRPSR